MHVDCSLPLWAFFDIYGSTNKLESLGMIALCFFHFFANSALDFHYLHLDVL